MMPNAAAIVLAIFAQAPGADEAPTQIARKPTEAARADESIRIHAPTGADRDRLRREHDFFRGVWTIESLTDDGEVLNATMIGEKVAENRRLTFGNRLIKLVNPVSGEPRTWTYRLDPSTSPRRLEIVNDHDEVIPGIYTIEGDQVRVCLAGGEDAGPPTEFSADGGSNRMLLTLRLVPAAQVRIEQESAQQLRDFEQDAREARESERIAEEAERIAREALARREPSAAERAAARDRETAGKLLGRWSLNDENGQVSIRFNADGTFQSSRNWDRALKRMFQGTSVSNGTWRVSDDLVTVYVAASTHRRLANTVVLGRISRIDDHSVVYTDALGRVHRAVRMP